MFRPRKASSPRADISIFFYLHFVFTKIGDVYTQVRRPGSMDHVKPDCPHS